MTNHCTHEYCPPEMARRLVAGNDDVTPLVATDKFDVWCLGVLVLKLFVESSDYLVEFHGLDEDGMLHLLASPGFVFMDSLDACALTFPQKRLLAKCLHPDPSARGSLADIQALLPRTATSSKATFTPLHAPIAPSPLVAPNASQPPVSVDVPCFWTLTTTNATDAWNQGERLRSTSFRLGVCCEMRDSSSCQMAMADNLVVEAQSDVMRRILPTLKASFLVFKAIALLTGEYGIAFRPTSFNMIVEDCPHLGKLIQAMESIHGVVTNPTDLAGIVSRLEDGEYETDADAAVEVDHLQHAITAHQAREAPRLIEVLRAIQMSGQELPLVKHVLRQDSHVRWVCRHHASQFLSSFQNEE
ncbi:Aste57867_4363 [Aphanomyces stellatus]|uniref:Aste57867_4363 protein n=1 Tax=Aphanomyces stellatus TaxID=120398 RepID=A0A485KFB4_9STRA|nr:hypothetical protein As57867_004351 [Aphanomyces stellatus]VFT81477.1 Aste57867_4363 [Aphanomyces stellatus]